MMAIPSNGDDGEESTCGNSRRERMLSSPLITVLTENCLGSQALGSATRGVTSNCAGCLVAPGVERPWAVAAAMGLTGMRTSQLAPEASRAADM